MTSAKTLSRKEKWYLGRSKAAKKGQYRFKPIAEMVQVNYTVCEKTELPFRIGRLKHHLDRSKNDAKIRDCDTQKRGFTP